MVATILLAPDVVIDVYPASAPSALSIYESLTALGIGTVGSWTDCAKRLEQAAEKATGHGQKQKLLDRADDCRSRARRALIIDIQTPYTQCSRPGCLVTTVGDDGLCTVCRLIEQVKS